MAITQIGGSTGSSALPTYWFLPPANNNVYYKNMTLDPGVYVAYLYPNNNSVNTSTMTLPSMEFKNGGGSTVASVGNGITSPTNTWTDLDSGSTSNALFTVFNLPNGATTIEYAAYSNAISIMLQKTSDAAVTATGYIQVSTITASGSVTLTAATNTIYAIGGGGSASGYYYNAYFGGNGGGSGYLATGTLSAGTYTATIGAGGAGVSNGGDYGGNTGGTTSIGSISAAGGAGGGWRGSSGGAGGSGGGGGTYTMNGGAQNVAGAGGFRGSSGGGTNGIDNPGNAGGSGSGVTPPALAGITFASAGGTVPGGAGGLYAGGAGGYYPSNAQGGAAAANTGGGGGAGGGAGGSGVIYVKAAM